MSNSNVTEQTSAEVKALETNVGEETSTTETQTQTTETSTEPKKEEVKVVTPTKIEVKDEISLTHLNKDFVYELMSIPTLSSNEYRLITFIILWARRNGIKYEFDEYGNVYLTKGELAEGEFYPCVTAHLDSVQQKHKLYAQAGQPLDIKTRIVKQKHEIYVDGMGIGGDDKAGILIGLSMFSHVDKLKACFFLEEEIGCKGSQHMNVEWFNNVGYVLGYDSPDLNRAAYACSGVKLFSAAFFKEHMQEICKAHGLTDFRSEPFTDVKVIREKTNIICMNFGSGYYNGHASNEYCVIEDMDTACRMGHALIEHLGHNQYLLEHKASYGANVYGKRADGTWGALNEDEDEKFLKTLSSFYNARPATRTSYPSSAAYGYEDYYGDYDDWEDYWAGKHTANHTSPASTSIPKTTPTTTPPKAEPSEETIPLETMKYITEVYDNRIATIELDIKKKCEELNISFDEFKSIFETKVTF